MKPDIRITTPTLVTELVIDPETQLCFEKSSSYKERMQISTLRFFSGIFKSIFHHVIIRENPNDDNSNKYKYRIPLYYYCNKK